MKKVYRELLDKLEPEVRNSFIKAMDKIKSSADLSAIISLLEAGRFEEVVIALRLEDVFFDQFGEMIGQSYRTGGVAAASSVKPILDPNTGQKFVFVFSARATRAEEWARLYSSNLISNITDDQKRMVRNVIEDGVRNGLNPRTVARDLVGTFSHIEKKRVGGFIGLSNHQYETIKNIREELLTLNPNYLTRKLRDKRYDSIFKKARLKGTPLTGAQLTTLLSRASDRTLAYRAEVIARTETLTALRAGYHEGFIQLSESGKVSDEQIIRTWSSTGDDRTREDHLTMNGQEVAGMNTPFTAPDGSQLMFPGDPSLGAAEEQTVQCRCIQSIRVKYIR